MAMAAVEGDPGEFVWVRGRRPSHETQLWKGSRREKAVVQTAGTNQEYLENLVQQLLSNISYLASSSLLPKLSVEGSIPFARSNVFKHLRHRSTHANCSWVRHGYAKREGECVS